MKDLQISYTTQNGKCIHKSYDTIMDFTDSMELDSIDEDMLNSHNIHADFFENPLLSKHFDTMRELYNHCIDILA